MLVTVSWKPNPEGGTTAFLTPDRHNPSVCLNDGLGDGQPKSISSFGP
jgi:hypothetical protein